MKQWLLIGTLLLAGLLAACTGGGGEEATAVPEPATAAPPLNPPPTDTPAAYPPAYPGADTAPTPDAAYPAGAEPATGSAYPVEVDLSQLTPQTPGNDNQAVAPPPGVPDTQTAVAHLVSQDLAARSGMDVSDISVVSVASVDWPDSALGCPAPGYAYMQVITPGYKIVLEASGESYEYHTDLNQNFVLCGADGQPVP